jgi:Flp pilus assembly protein TadG
MRKILRLLAADIKGNAAVEMALVTPFLLILMMGSVELGNYFMDEHRLVKSVRDGARFAARQSFTNYTTCSGDLPTPGTAGSANENTKLIVEKGTLDSTQPNLLSNWSSATYSATISCASTVDSQTMLGIYRSRFGSTCNGAAASGCAQVVTVTVQLPYRSVLGMLGFTGVGWNLNASSQAAVAGI